MEDMVQKVFVDNFADLPLWARILFFLFFAYLVAGGLKSSIVQPIASVGRATSSAVKTAGVWWERFRPPPPPPPPPPGRDIPEEKTIFEEHSVPGAPRPLRIGIPIISVANLKGGVGKTTIAANLALALRDHHQRPVLLIDFDYQGSLSQCIRGEAGLTQNDLTADVLIGNGHEDPLPYMREMGRGVRDVFLYPTNYPFATIENRLLAEWMRERQPDFMYRLCTFLRRKEIQDKFCAVIIDCPPRLTAGSINALCASTHVLVPTKLDDMSAQAAMYFLTQLDRMRKAQVFPDLTPLGIVPSIHWRDAEFAPDEAATMRKLKAYGSEKWERNDFVLDDGRVPDISAIRKHSGSGVAYTQEGAARRVFQRLATAVASRLKNL